MVKEDNKNRDFIVALLSILGIKYFAGTLFNLYFILIKISASQVPANTFRLLAWLAFAIFIICGFFVRKYVKISDTYRKWFTIFWVILIINDFLVTIGMLYPIL